VISADAHTKHGFNTSCAIIDELHAQPNRELVDVITTSTGARLQPLIVFITTADYERPSICNEKYDYSCKVRDSLIPAPEFLPVIYEAGITDDWKLSATWKKANPCYGVSISETYLQKEFNKALETPSYENTFKRLHLNMKTQVDIRWISMDRWNLCNKTIDIGALAGAECFGGLDLASTQDIAAYVLYFPNNDCAVVPFFFVPEETAKLRDRQGRVPYLTWARQGFIILTPGNVIDYDYIRQVILESNQTYNVKEIAYDRWGACQLVTQLEGEGMKMEPFGQGFASMNVPCKELEKLVASGELAHGNNPVMNWMVGNAAAEMDPAGNVKPAKNKSSDKIDGVVALVMGIGRAVTNMASIYDTRGILQL
jgi:phage terminase large subunit-like protein